MKRKITFLIAAIAAIMLITQPMKVLGQSTSVTNFIKNGSSNTVSANSVLTYNKETGQTGIDWETSSGTNGWDNDRGHQYTYGNSTNITTTISGATITNVTITASSNYLSGTKRTFSVSVGGSSIESSKEISNGNGQTFSFSDSDGKSGEIEIGLSSSSSSNAKSVWIKSISVTYTTGNSVTVTSPIANGSISAAPNSGVSANTNVTLTITPDDGYALSTLSVVDGSSNPITVTNKVFKMPNSAATVTGTFATKRQVTYSATNGTIAGVDCSGTAVATNGYVGQGGTLKVTATPTSGYIFTGWEVSSGTTIDDASANPAVVTLGSADATITASFSASYTVTYHANGGTGDDVVENKLSGASVVAIANPFTPADGKLFNYYTLDEEGNGTHYAPGDQITASISEDMNVYAQWRDIKYTVTLDVNGNTSVIAPITNITYGGNTGAITNATMDGYTFMGWSETRNGSIAVNPGGSYTPTGSDEAITLYAVFGKTTPLSLTLNPSDIPNTYSNDSYSKQTMQGKSFYMKNMMNQSSTIQFKASKGAFYNESDWGKITSIVITYYTSGGGNNQNISVNAGTSANPGSGSITPTNSGRVFTFTFTGDKHYFKMYCGDSYTQLSSIVIYYETTVQQNVIPLGTTTATEAMSITTPTVISNGAILNMDNNTLSIGAGGSLTIEDGGQLILAKTNTGVAATVKKDVSAATPASKTDATYWYAISAGVENPSISSNTNLITESGGDPTYDLYRFNEAKNTGNAWENYRNSDYSATFTTLEKGRGYLYRNASDLTITMTGDINVEDFTYNVTKTGSGEYAGFNLIGNPYTHNIYKGTGTAITNGTSTLSTGFYYLEPSTGKWAKGTDQSTAIAPNQGILVQVNETGNINMTNTDDDGVAKSHNDYIMLSVANSQYSDEAYAWFDEGIGLNKIEHRNSEIPMLYINQNGENFAIATMSDETQSFNLNFKAATMGKYTLSYETKGEYSYLHVIDRLTGEDVDMLMDGEYSFIASPIDSENRFIVRLEYSAGSEISESSVFAYQSGNDIIVNGEGELQIFDMMGRRVLTQYVSGVETINLQLNGVYIFRLNEKTQKIVVK